MRTFTYMFDNAHVATFPGNSSECLASFTGVDGTKTRGGVPMISVGRLGSIGANSSDVALVALIDAAKGSLKILQQDIGPPTIGPLSITSWPDDLLDALVRALGRGVEVTIVVSNVGAVPGGLTGIEAAIENYGNGWTPGDVARRLADRVRKHPGRWTGPADVVSHLCDKLKVLTFRASDAATWPDGQELAFHSKVIVVDDRAFYIGSQNMYVSNLAELGFIVDHEATTRAFVKTYVDQALKYSTATTPTTCPLR